MAFDFPGGIGEVEIDDVGTFDTGASTDPSSFLITIGRNQIAKEGTEFADPEAVTAQLADDREMRMGVNQPVSLRLSELPMSDFSTLETQCDAGNDLWMKVLSAAKNNSGNPIWEIVYKQVILSNVLHGPVSADRSSYGVVLLDGMATGFNSEDIYSLTQRDPSA
jgi:hypothetical protein